MINVSQAFKNNSKKVKQQNVKLTINGNTEQKIEVVTNLAYQNIPIENLRANNRTLVKKIVYSFEGQLFKTVMKQIEMTVKNASAIKEQNINFQFGVLVNNQFEYVDLGDFYIKDIEDDKNKEEIIAVGYDKMINFMREFNQDELQIEYPCSILNFIRKICQVCEVELYSTNFFNSNLSVTEDFFTGQELSYRDVLEKIAEATLTTAIIKDNKLYLKKVKTQVDETLDLSYLTNLVIKEKFGPVNALVLGRGDVEDNVEEKDDESIEENGRCEIRFDENEFVEYIREQVIESMFEQVDGLEYYVYEGADVGITWLEPCDTIELNDREGNIYKTLYMRAHITVSTGIKSDDIGAEAIEETNTKYKVTSKEQKKTLKVERLAKKNEGIIQDLVQETDDHTEKLTQQQQDIDSIKNQVSSKADYKREVEGVTEIHLENANSLNILELQIKGNKTYEANLYPSDDLYPSSDLYPNMEGAELM